MRIILTRPEEDAAALSTKLKALGHDPLLMPLLRIEPVQNLIIPDRPYQALCLTSANGLRGLPADHILGHLPLYAVGPQSAAAAQAHGFFQTVSAGGDVASLLSLIARRCEPHKGPILYLSGETVSADLAGLLGAQGFSVERLITYRAIAAIPETLANSIETAEAVLLYSARSAQLFIKAVHQYRLESAAARLVYYCLSSAVAAHLLEDWQCRVARRPDEAAMLALLVSGHQNG